MKFRQLISLFFDKPVSLGLSIIPPIEPEIVIHPNQNLELSTQLAKIAGKVMFHDPLKRITMGGYSIGLYKIYRVDKIITLIEDEDEMDYTSWDILIKDEKVIWFDDRNRLKYDQELGNLVFKVLKICLEHFELAMIEEKERPIREQKRITQKLKDFLY